MTLAVSKGLRYDHSDYSHSCQVVGHAGLGAGLGSVVRGVGVAGRDGREDGIAVGERVGANACGVVAAQVSARQPDHGDGSGGHSDGMEVDHAWREVHRVVTVSYVAILVFLKME